MKGVLIPPENFPYGLEGYFCKLKRTNLLLSIQVKFLHGRQSKGFTFKNHMCQLKLVWYIVISIASIRLVRK